MAQKSDRPGAGSSGIPPFPENIKDSAQQIWLAGLGAFNKAQEEGSKVFDALVQEGLTIQRKTQATAEEKLSEATHKVSNMASELSSRATGQWDKLETIFEDRVAKAMHRLGVHSAKEVHALAARVEELSKAIEKLSSKPTARAATGKRATAGSAPKKPAAKRKPPRKTA
jgi:poly(hydroxyalkanoate) granule-associated protein